MLAVRATSSSGPMTEVAVVVVVAVAGVVEEAEAAAVAGAEEEVTTTAAVGVGHRVAVGAEAVAAVERPEAVPRARPALLEVLRNGSAAFAEWKVMVCST